MGADCGLCVVMGLAVGLVAFVGWAVLIASKGWVSSTARGLDEAEFLTMVLAAGLGVFSGTLVYVGLSLLLTVAYVVVGC